MRRFAITPGDARSTPGAVRALAGRYDALIVREPALSADDLLGLVDAGLEVGLEVWVHARHPSAGAVADARGLGLHLPASGGAPDRPHGRSCHDPSALDRAFADGARYALLSPVFPPGSKPDDRRPPLGIERFLAWSAGRPVAALGGIDAARAAELEARGAWGVAQLGAAFPQKTNSSSS